MLQIFSPICTAHFWPWQYYLACSPTLLTRSQSAPFLFNLSNSSCLHCRHLVHSRGFTTALRGVLLFLFVSILLIWECCWFTVPSSLGRRMFCSGRHDFVQWTDWLKMPVMCLLLSPSHYHLLLVLLQCFKWFLFSLFPFYNLFFISQLERAFTNINWVLLVLP